MKRIMLCAAMIMLCGLIASCSKPDNLLERFRLEPTNFHLEDAKLALAEINLLLSEEGRQPFAIYQNAPIENAINLLWVGGKNLSHTITDMMFVPENCQCVIVQPEVFYTWLRDYNTVGYTQYEVGEDFIRILSYLLLHEYGHVVNKHPGRAIAQQSTTSFNNDETVDKFLEQQADDFASGIIAKYNAKTEAFDTWLAAANIFQAITSTAFTAQGKRVVDNFGCSALDAPCAFHDMGDTHFNFEYRLLKAQCLIAGENTEDCDFLSVYENRRNSGGIFPGGILYRRDDPSTQ